MDVVQLADTFQNFRKTAHKTYRMDIAYFVTLPSYTWGACLKFTKVKLEQLVDIEIINMYADGKRGDITHAITRYAKANNKYIPNYDPKKPSSNLMYEDGNNLYGWAMCKNLPVKEFKWVNETDKFTQDFIKNYDFNESIVYCICVDVDYPKSFMINTLVFHFLLKN